MRIYLGKLIDEASLYHALREIKIYTYIQISKILIKHFSYMLRNSREL